jgi:DNA invertase Pin-like site-specific DNA recombinase
MLIGYARVSKKDQDISLQVEALKKAGVDERNIFQEKFSGYAKNRPVLKEVMGYLRNGDVFLVYKLDRLGRSLHNLLEIIENFKKLGVSFRSITENFDTTTPVGTLLFHFLAVFADFERVVMIERTKDAVEVARDRGVRIGRKPIILTKEQTDQVLEFYNQGKSLSFMSRILNISRTPIRKWLKNQKFVAQIENAQKEIPGVCEEINLTEIRIPSIPSQLHQVQLH